MEGVLASALGVRPADGAGGAGGRPELHGAAVPDAEAVEPVLLREPGRRLHGPALHGIIGLRSAAAGEPGEDALDTGTQVKRRGR